MNKTAIFLAYYFYAIIVVVGTGYIVFGLDRSSWWFVMTILLLQIQPEIKENKRPKRREFRY